MSTEKIQETGAVVAEEGRAAYFFEVEGQKFRVHESSLSVRRIKEIAGTPSDVPLVRILPDGTQVTLRDDDVVTFEQPGASFKRLPRFVRG
jgi:hypothetical protein